MNFELRILVLKFAVRTLLLGGGRFRCCVGVLLGETFDAAGSVDQFLLTREKRMAVGADFDIQPVPFDRGTGLEIVSTGAMNGYGMIVGVDTGFHAFLFE